MKTFIRFWEQPEEGVKQIELTTRMAVGVIDRLQQLLTMGSLPNSEGPVRTTMVVSLRDQANNLERQNFKVQSIATSLPCKGFHAQLSKRLILEMLDKEEQLVRRCRTTNELMKHIIKSKRAPLDDLIVQYIAFCEASQTALFNAAALMCTTRGYLAYETFSKAQDIVIWISDLGLRELNEQTPENHPKKRELLRASNSTGGSAQFLGRLYARRNCEYDEPDESQKGWFNWLGEVFSVTRSSTGSGKGELIQSDDKELTIPTNTLLEKEEREKSS